MPTYTPWTWSPAHSRHYMYLLADDGRTILETLWAGPPAAAVARPALNAAPSNALSRGSHAPAIDEDESENEADEEDEDEDESDEEEAGHPSHSTTAYYAHSSGAPKGKERRIDSPFDAKAFQKLSIHPVNSQTSSSNRKPRSDTQVPQVHQGRSSVANLPLDIQAQLKALERRYIRTDPSTNNEEFLDARYRRVAAPYHAHFFVPGRVFKMLWSEPAGQANPGKTRNSTHFSTVWLGEQAFSEIRHFIVVRNKGSFSQCIPIQTYRGLGAAKPGLVMEDHGIIHTTPNPPDQLANEALTKYSIRVEPTSTEILSPGSRVNYGKAYAVEHNVKVLDVGMVVKTHRYLLSIYFDAAMRG